MRKLTTALRLEGSFQRYHGSLTRHQWLYTLNAWMER